MIFCFTRARKICKLKAVEERWTVSRIVIVILIHRHHKRIDLRFLIVLFPLAENRGFPKYDSVYDFLFHKSSEICKLKAVEERGSLDVGTCDADDASFGEMNQCASIWEGWG
jgi:hypothetical protein